MRKKMTETSINSLVFATVVSVQIVMLGTTLKVLTDVIEKREGRK